MPQFDIYSFSSQCFWVLFIFYLVYFVLVYYYVVSIASVLKIRQKLISLYSISNKKDFVSLNLFDKYISFIVKKVLL